MSWNLEGLRRNIYNLSHFVNIHKPDLVFLSEPQIHSCNLDLAARPLSGTYLYSLNSADKYDPELPLVRSKAYGGTMVLWKIQHDPFITVHPVSSTAFLPVLFHPPGSTMSIHIAVYLPTLGKEVEFVEELSKLSVTIDDLVTAHPTASVFIRGDFNVSRNNKHRSDLLDHFCAEHQFLQSDLPKPTYHHFLGDGKSDSYLDRLLFPACMTHHEVVKKIECKLSNPLVNSHHDVIISNWFIPTEVPPNQSEENIVAPTAANKRLQVICSDSGIQDYQDLVVPQLERIQNLWLASPSKSSVSLLLSSSNNILTSCAAMTNRTLPLNCPPAPASGSVPKAVRLSKNALLKQCKEVRKAESTWPAQSSKIKDQKAAYNKARIAHRKLERAHKANDSIKRDENLFSILSSNPSSIYKSVKRSKRSKAGKINKLQVGNKTYLGESAKDGFFDSISSQKTCDTDALNASEYFGEFSFSYLNILEVCRNGDPIPQISESDSFNLLQRLKPHVNDVFGVTANHYNYAGPAGWKHFHLLLSSLLIDVDNTSIEEVNIVYACVLFKGHGKEKTLDRSYRTISTCPIVAKALDLYIRDLNIINWNQVQAETQFQGEGSSHELAAVLLTESI